jgi:predicted transposase YdaD
MAGTPYDPVLKDLVESDPASWPALLGSPTGPTEIIDADIATVTGAADKVIHVSADPAYLLHLEFVSGHDAAALPSKLLMRNGLLDDRHGLRVRTGVVLLHPKADSPQMTGLYQRGFPGEEPYLSFRYDVLRVWQLSPEPLLSGGLATLPLAPISAVTEAQLPGIIERIGRRLGGRRARGRARVVWAAAYILSGLRYSPALAAQLFRGVVSMKESSTYQAILEEGRVEGRLEGRAEGAIAEARRVLRRLGDRRFGVPDPRTDAAISAIADLTRLEELLDHVLTASSWEDLLGLPARTRKRSRGSSS